MDKSQQFPKWFKEGITQSSAGGWANSNDWVNDGLGLNVSSSEDQISAAVKVSANKLTGRSTASQYGTGYLASMYLGYLAAGKPGQCLEASIEDAHAVTLGLDYVNVLNKDDASYSIDICDDALDKISSNRSQIGAYVNRLEHTVKNLDNVVENTQAAESRIRDTDIAKEMVEYAKTNILAQVGESMTAQANQNKQQVLGLLQ